VANVSFSKHPVFAVYSHNEKPAHKTTGKTKHICRGLPIVSDVIPCSLLVAANVPSSPILVTLMMKALSSFETSVLARATRRNMPEDAILHSLVDVR
jgi:hypothetical protein